MPHRSSVPMQWRLKQSRYSLTGMSCVCGQLYFPPRAVCSCGNDKLASKTFTGNGEIISFTEIHVAPAGFDRNTPYNVALIRLEEGPVVSGIVIGTPAIGKKVRSIFRRLYTDGHEGLVSYGFKFEVVE